MEGGSAMKGMNAAGDATGGVRAAGDGGRRRDPADAGDAGLHCQQHHQEQQCQSQRRTAGPAQHDDSAIQRPRGDAVQQTAQPVDDINPVIHRDKHRTQNDGGDITTAAKLAPAKLNAPSAAPSSSHGHTRPDQHQPFPAATAPASTVGTPLAPPPAPPAAAAQGSVTAPRRTGLLDLRQGQLQQGRVDQDHHPDDEQQHDGGGMHTRMHRQMLLLDAVTPGIHPATYVDPYVSPAAATPHEVNACDEGSCSCFGSAASTPAVSPLVSRSSRPVVVGGADASSAIAVGGASCAGYFDLQRAPPTRVGPGSLMSARSTGSTTGSTCNGPAASGASIIGGITSPAASRVGLPANAGVGGSTSNGTSSSNSSSNSSTTAANGTSVIPLTRRHYHLHNRNNLPLSPSGPASPPASASAAAHPPAPAPAPPPPSLAAAAVQQQRRAPSSKHHYHHRPSHRRHDDDARPRARRAMARRQSLSEIRAANPELALSGNIISATFNIPHALTYKKDGDWDLKPRRGQSALFDSFAYLSSDATPWNHHVVAWTGEIEDPYEPSPPPPESPAAHTTVGASSLNALSAPVPVDAGTRLPTPPAVDGLWIPREHQQRLDHLLSRSKTIRTSPVWLADEADSADGAGIMLRDQARWRRYAQYDLYTLFHYKQHEPTDGRKERVHYADYFRMNQKFADKIIEVYKPGDIVIVHDYYLMLLPSMLRQRVPNMYISFFLHSPFPSSEFLRCLPRRKEVLEGVLGANLVGFQSYSYSRHFLSCCTRILGFPSDTLGIDAYGSRVQVGVFPIGIDAARVETAAWADSVEEKFKALKKMYAGKKIIVGRDRLDSARGVAQKLQAFERFLDMFPEWREKVVLIQVTSPTSADAEPDDTDGKLSSRVNELVMKINGDYGSLGFTPVHHYPQYLRQDEYFALLRAADIGLITSVRDGMNTTSLEYVVCQKQGHGPLILSEFSGTAGSLADAIHINPWDLSGVASEINTALTMPEDQRRVMQERLYHHVTTHNVQSWIDKFIRRVYTVLGEAGSAHATPLLDRALLLSQYRSAGKRLFMFDYDGTLTPIVREPSAAIPSERIIAALKLLAADERNAVWIISGRDQEFLGHHLGHISRLGFSAEHGSFMRNPGSQEWVNLAEKFDMGWQAEVMEVFQKYTDKVQGSFIERKRCALTWHYRQADPELGAHMSRACHKELEAGVGSKWEVEVMPGKANIEVRPTFINKGEIAKRLIATYHNPEAEPTADDPNPGRVEFSLCMGDDFTDEDMFRALNGASGPVLKADHVFTVTVGASTKVTLAKWHLLEPEDVIDCVALLAGAEGGPAGTERLGEVNLAALSMVEGKIPAGEV